MFQTLAGSLIILLVMLGIIFVLALLLTALLRWIFLTDIEAAETTTVDEPPMAYPHRKAA